MLEVMDWIACDDGTLVKAAHVSALSIGIVFKGEKQYFAVRALLTNGHTIIQSHWLTEEDAKHSLSFLLPRIR